MIKYGTDPLFPHTSAYSLNCGCEAIQFDRLMSCSGATLVTPCIDTCDCSACFFPKKKVLQNFDHNLGIFRL